MKLLIFSPYYPPHMGGLESHSDEFNKHLNKRGVAITVFTPRLPKAAPEIETRHENVRIIRFPAFELFPNYPLPKFWESSFWQMWQCVLEEDTPDLIISRTRFFFTSLMAWRYARKKKLPWIHIEHGSDFAHFNSPLKTALGKFYDYTIGASVLRHSDYTIANSRASAAFVRRLAKRTDCQIIYRGVEYETLLATPIDTALRTAHPRKIIIGYIGRLIDGKGVATLITALSSFTRDDYICLIIGDGPEKENLSRLVIQKKLQEKVFFLGRQNFPKAMALLKTCDIFVNPSYTEGIPTAVIEAAFCKTAIIATNVGGTNEIISGENDGFLIPPKNILALQEKIECLLNDQNLRKEFGDNAYRAVENKFDWKRSAKQYQELFQEILNR